MRLVFAVSVAAFLSVVLAVTLAGAPDVTLPPEATMVVTDEEGVIVGVGHCLAGERFVLEVIAAYQGFARLMIVSSDGDVAVHDVVVTNGAVLLEFVDLRDVATRSGFVDVVVEAIDVVDVAGVGPPGWPPVAAPDAGRVGVGAATPATDVASTDPVSDDRPVAAPAPDGLVPAAPIGVPVADPPVTPTVPVSPSPPVVPGPPNTPPAPVTPAPPVAPVAPGPPDAPVAPGQPDRPGPPASTPGQPEGPPAHGPGGAQGVGPGGPAEAPATGGEDDDDADDERPLPPGQDRRP